MPIPPCPATHDTYAKNDGVLSAWFGGEALSVTWEVTGHSPSMLQELIYARRNWKIIYKSISWGCGAMVEEESKAG